MKSFLILFFVLLFISSDIMACEGEPLYPDTVEIKINIIP